MKKKSFALGYSLVINWSLSWMFYNFTCTVSSNIYREAIATKFGISPAPMLDALTYYGFISLVLYFVVPKLISKFGTKKPLVIGAIMGGLAYALTPLSSNTLVIGILIGVTNFAAILYCVMTSMIMVSRWFPRKKGTVMGIITAAGIFSNMVCLPIFNNILMTVSIDAAMAVFGGILVLYGIVSIFWVKETPEEAGLLPDNMPMTDEERKQLSMGAESAWRYRDVLRNSKFWLVSIGWGLNLTALVGIAMVAISHIVARGVPYGTVVGIASMMGIMIFASSTLSGILDDKLGTNKSIWIVIGLQVIGFALAAFYGGGSVIALSIMYILAYGTSGANNNLFSSQVLNMFGTRSYSIVYAAFLSIVNLLKSFATFIDARSLEWTGSYDAAFIIFFFCGAVGIIMISLAGQKKIPEPDIVAAVGEMPAKQA